VSSETTGRLGAAAAPATGGVLPPTAVLGAVADAFFLGPGFTLLVTGGLAALALAGQHAAVESIAFALTLLFVGPHYAATYRRAYFNPAVWRAHPVVTLVVPVALAVTAVAAVRWPGTVGAAYFAAYVVWSGYHYSEQSLGLALLFPLRAGARLTRAEKRFIALPLYGSWLLSLLGLASFDVAMRNPAYQLTRDVFLPVRLPAGLLGAAMVCVLGSSVSVVVLALRRRRAGLPFPAPVFLIVGAQLLWFCGGLWNPFLNVVLVPIFHGAQYLALTGWHQTRGRPARAFALYAATVLLLGLAVNPGLLALGRALGGSTPVVAAAVLSFINLHHFLMDGRIWRLREQRVAASFVSPSAASASPAPERGAPA
jgi:hypothetical protein